MKLSICEIFEDECQGIEFDKKMLKRVCELESYFVNKKPEHIEFFGGALTGVQVVRFTTDDRDKLFSDILQADDRILQDRLSEVPAVNPEYIVSSDTFNIACVWIMHAFFTSKHLDEEDRNEGMIRICQYLQYKFLTSRLYQSFKYPADRAVAEAAYAQMTMKFSLKFHGSWGKALRARAEEVVAKTSIHRSTIESMSDDYRVVYMLNDIQGRIRDMLKNIMALFMRVHSQGTRISSSSSLIETDGEYILKDKAGNISNYARYIRSIISDQNSFIRQELIDVIVNAVQTVPEKLLVNTLKWCSQNYKHMQGNNDIEEAVNLIMEHAFEYFSENRSILQHKGDLAGMLGKLKGVYMSSRSTNVKLLEIREKVGKIVAAATKSKNESVVSSTRTGFMLYIVLRAFTMQHYTSR